MVWAGLVGIALIALFGGLARFIRLDEFPPGLADVEASHGVLARQASDFGIRWAMDNAADLSIPLVAAISWIGGFTGFDSETPRLAAAIFGVASILATGLWLFRAIGPLWGVAGAAVLAGSFWHLLYSRLATGQIIGAFALAALAWFLTEAAERRGPSAMPWYLLAGLAAGLGFLSTPALRLLPLALLAILIVSLARLRSHPNEWRQDAARNWLIASAAAYLSISPFLIANRDDFRLWTPWTHTPGLPGADLAAPAAFPGALIETALGLVRAGDIERGLNLPSVAWFSLLILPWAAIGLLGLISASNQPELRDRFLVGLGILAAAGIGISAVDAGHPGQLVVISPALAGVAVFGFRTILQWAKVRTVRVALALLIVTGVLGDAWIGGQRYVDEWASDPQSRVLFHADLINALNDVESLDRAEPIFVSATDYGSVLDYFRTASRRHPFDGARVLPFPADENGYLLVPASHPIDPQLAQLLEGSGSGSAALDGGGYRGYRLDGRIRDLMPLSVPTAVFPRGPVLHGASDLARVDDGQARFLIAWKSEPESPAFQIEARLKTTDPNSVETSAVAELPANPLRSRLFQVVIVEIDVPERDAMSELQIRLRREDGALIPVLGMDEDGYLLLNRYRLTD
jgi:hypothetical protein